MGIIHGSQLTGGGCGVAAYLFFLVIFHEFVVRGRARVRCLPPGGFRQPREAIPAPAGPARIESSQFETQCLK